MSCGRFQKLLRKERLVFLLGLSACVDRASVVVIADALDLPVGDKVVDRLARDRTRDLVLVADGRDRDEKRFREVLENAVAELLVHRGGVVQLILNLDLRPLLLLGLAASLARKHELLLFLPGLGVLLGVLLPLRVLLFSHILINNSFFTFGLCVR